MLKRTRFVLFYLWLQFVCISESRIRKCPPSGGTVPSQESERHRIHNNFRESLGNVREIGKNEGGGIIIFKDIWQKKDKMFMLLRQTFWYWVENKIEKIWLREMGSSLQTIWRFIISISRAQLGIIMNTWETSKFLFRNIWDIEVSSRFKWYSNKEKWILKKIIIWCWWILIKNYKTTQNILYTVFGWPKCFVHWLYRAVNKCTFLNSFMGWAKLTV